MRPSNPDIQPPSNNRSLLRKILLIGVVSLSACDTKTAHDQHAEDTELHELRTKEAQLLAAKDELRAIEKKMFDLNEKMPENVWANLMLEEINLKPILARLESDINSIDEDMSLLQEWKKSDSKDVDGGLQEEWKSRPSMATQEEIDHSLTVMMDKKIILQEELSAVSAKLRAVDLDMQNHEGTNYHDLINDIIRQKYKLNKEADLLIGSGKKLEAELGLKTEYSSIEALRPDLNVGLAMLKKKFDTIEKTMGDKTVDELIPTTGPEPDDTEGWNDQTVGSGDVQALPGFWVQEEK